jgi:exodeoxyribonuclease V gamma subunit
MLTIYHSNQLDLLKSLIAELIEQNPLSDPFEKEVILVQSHGMAQWLQIELANRFGVAANIDFPLPASFIWQMFSLVLPDIPQESAFSKPVMTWKLMTLLPKMSNQPEFKPLKHYLSDDDDRRKCYQLAARVADLFDQYLVYRPDWLNAWQSQQLIDGLDPSQLWQAPLWRALVNYTERLEQPQWHRANLYQRFITKLNEAGDRPQGLPKRIFICGISALPPVYLQTLQALGRHIDVHLMFTNPCRYYWGDIQDYAFLARLQANRRRHFRHSQQIQLFQNVETAENLFDERGEQQISNPLLASWGKLGRDNLFLLAQMDGTFEVDAFVDIDNDCLLHRIQNDILQLNDFAVIGDSPEQLLTSEMKRPLADDDRSLSFHACHSAQREVEVLYDNLLAILDAPVAEGEPPLSPRDIIVMVADIDSYTPYIQAVFGNAPQDRFLPYAISDRRATEAHPILQAFLRLLELPQSRFSAEDIIDLIEVSALAKRFDIDEAGLRILRVWIEESGIRWGLDDDNVLDFDLPVTGQNTWQFGLTRMLLGYAMESQSGDWNGVLPYDESSGLIAALAGQLADLLTALSHWRRHLSAAYTLVEWQPVCQQLLQTFFVADAETEAVLTLIEQQWQQVINFGVGAEYDQDVPLAILYDELNARLNNERISQRFLAGSINFCTLMPMRSIPFKVVCLLGMNDGVYPRTIQPLGFDLMQSQTRRGDRSRRDDDRYLFLEACLSAQQRLYISYIGHSIQDNSPRYPSVLVSELIDYVSQSHVLTGDRLSNVDDSAKNVKRHLIIEHPRMPFSRQNFKTGEFYQSYAVQWLSAARGEGENSGEFGRRLSEAPLLKLEIDDLRRFYRHPVRAFFQQRLQVHFSLDEPALEDEEPFNIDSLKRYKMNSQLLNVLINQQDAERLFNRLKAAGELPFGAFAELFWQQQLQEMSELADQIQSEMQTVESREFSLQIADTTLFGWIHQAQDDGVLRWRAAELTILDGLTLWLDHLVYCYLGGTGESRMYGRKNSQWRFMPLSHSQAADELARLIAGYKQGMSEPLLLLPKSGWEWLNQCYDKKSGTIDREQNTQDKARIKFIQMWQGDRSRIGEADDSYYMRLFRVLTDQRLQEMLSLSEYYLLPLAKFKK